MNITRFCVDRPVFTTMATSISVLVGLVSMSRMRTELLPEVELPAVTVRAQYPGASPQVMEQRVTQILEEILATVPGVMELRSQSAFATAEVQAVFAWGNDIDTAALDVSARLENEMSELPEDMPRPEIRKFDSTSFPVVLVGVSSEIDPVELTSLVEEEVRPRLSRIPMIAQVDTWGGFEREIRIELDLSRLQALVLSVDQVAEAIRASNVNLPAGQVDAGRLEITLRVPAEYKSIDELRRIGVTRQGSRVVTLEEIAEVKDTYQRVTRVVRINGKPGLRLAVRKQANANTAEVARRVVTELLAIRKDYPQIDIVPLSNQGDFIERSIANVSRSVAYGGIFAVFVLLFFLLSLRSTVAIALSIPISIATTFAVMFGAGLTLNLTTLGGLALGVGMMVDSSIVVLENIYRRQSASGEPVDRACVVGAQEVAPAILASTITTAVVFLPLGFISGLSRMLFLDMAYVVVFSLGCSLVVSVTALPTIAAYLLKRPSKTSEYRVVRTIRLMTEALEDRYIRILRTALRFRWVTVGVALGLLVASLGLRSLIGSELLPPSDEGEVRVSAEYEVGTRLDILEAGIDGLESLVFPEVPELTAAASFGVTPGRFSDTSRIDATLNVGSATTRKRSSQAIANDLRAKLEDRVSGSTVRVRAPRGNFVLARLLRTESGIDVEVRGFDFDILDTLVRSVRKKIEPIPGVTDVEVERQQGVPQVDIEVDRMRVASLGISPEVVGRALEASVAGTEVGNFRDGEQSYRIFLQLGSVRTLSLDEVLSLPLSNADGVTVPLRSLVKTRDTLGPVLINRKDQQRIVTVSANIAGRDLGSVAKDIRDELESLAVPPGYEVRLSGAAEEQQSSFRELLKALLFALALIYMVLASQYESFIRPLVVMLSIPLGAAGVLATLYLTDTTLNIQSYIGCVMLGGILVNNAILLVDQAQTLVVREGMSSYRAAMEAGRRRLRPILMTTATTVLGLVPLAFGWGEGADAQAPLARTVIGGLLGSTPLTLLLVPAVFTLFERRSS